jgi:hypothetical protein
MENRQSNNFFNLYVGKNKKQVQLHRNYTFSLIQAHEEHLEKVKEQYENVVKTSKIVHRRDDGQFNGEHFYISDDGKYFQQIAHFNDNQNDIRKYHEMMTLSVPTGY